MLNWVLDMTWHHWTWLQAVTITYTLTAVSNLTGSLHPFISFFMSSSKMTGKLVSLEVKKLLHIHLHTYKAYGTLYMVRYYTICIQVHKPVCFWKCPENSIWHQHVYGLQKWLNDPVGCIKIYTDCLWGGNSGQLRKECHTCCHHGYVKTPITVFQRKSGDHHNYGNKAQQWTNMESTSIWLGNTATII